MFKRFLSIVSISACLLSFNTLYAETNTDINKKIVSDFFNAVVNKKDFVEATQYIGPWYTEHSPHAKDGTQGLKELIDYLKQYPQSRGEIKRVIAEGDYVLLHVHERFEPSKPGFAVAEIFRLENGKVVEHWDVTQEVPEKFENPNGMF